LESQRAVTESCSAVETTDKTIRKSKGEETNTVGKEQNEVYWVSLEQFYVRLDGDTPIHT